MQNFGFRAMLFAIAYQVGHVSLGYTTLLYTICIMAILQIVSFMLWGKKA